MAATSSSSSSSNNQAVDNLQKTPVIVQWTQTIELGYASEDAVPSNSQPVCFRCGKTSTAKQLSKCAQCQVASYCCKECQVQDWKAVSKGGGGHKAACASYARLELVVHNNNRSSAEWQIKSDAFKETVRNELFGRIRIYACSYAVHRTATLGKGFLFLQSDSTLATLSTPTPMAPKIKMRALLMHFLTLAEYDSEVCRDDFEMAEVRTQLQHLVNNDYDDQNEVVLLLRFRCGHVALGKGTLVPDYGVCKVLGQQYFETTTGAVQLNLDDM
ncbi:expressed unknown protein [Seminavis robusta]|uniref:MYND-type domain-containing protein n=1 Tax=Seminavis robusta TaxID=568900 RepID=A0A9N8EK62_9STRA|nr:expressed unknown protein [Seminavis robusta]|eukprot:Sro1281_g258920.1 n/a (272) ;mRNA; r:14937-15752